MDTLGRFSVETGFFKHYEDLVIREVIPYQEMALRDEIDGAEKSHAIENFTMAAQVIATGHSEGEFYGMVFQDSDVYKWLEAVAYSLRIHPDAALEARADDIITLIERAQHPDGYLNTYFTVKAPDKRWTNLQEAHELYCAGHMIEAAVAFAESTGKTHLLRIARRMADHIYTHFITDGHEGFCGHPEIELALMRLYHLTEEPRYLELAGHFIDARGTDFFIRERAQYPWMVWGNNALDREYTQTHQPVREQTDAVGHAVRAVYLYAGMADTAHENGDAALAAACRTLWESITRRRMYVTGGIGSAYEGECFTKDYHLPNDTVYAETCASVALVFFARQMLTLDKRAEYADVMERALYNVILAGMQLDGKRFFYVNPLEALPGISGEAITHKHALPVRPKWFACACCPPNVARLLTSLGRYAWSVEDATVYSHLFITGTLILPEEIGGSITLDTAYPYEGALRYRIHVPKGTACFTLAIRLPAWSRETTLHTNGQPATYAVKDGFALLTREFADGDEIAVSLDMSVRRVFPSQHIAADSARVAFTRGPLVYCAEGVDNADDVLGLRVERETPVSTLAMNALGDIVALQVKGYRLRDKGALYAYDRPQAEPCDITLIPYYAWGNRGLNEMRVWLPEA